MILKSSFLVVFSLFVLTGFAQEKPIIINDDISVTCFQVVDGRAAEPRLKNSDVDEIFVSVPAFRGRCEIDIRLVGEEGEEIPIMSKRKRNDAIGVTFDPGNGNFVQVVIFSDCKKMVLLNTINGPINITGRSVVGRINLKVD